MRAAAPLVALLALAGCANQPKPACPAGQSELRTAQLFLGAKAPVRLTDADVRRFVDQEVTPRFPDGVSIVDGGGQWKGAENQLIREAAKVVLIVLPPKGDFVPKVEEVRAAYRTRFRQDSVFVAPPSTCVTL